MELKYKKELKVSVITRVTIIAFILISSCISLSAQFVNDISIDCGYTSQHILFDNPGAMEIFDPDTNKSAIIGGSFNGPESGASVLINFNHSKNSRIFFPVGIYYYGMRSNEAYPASKTLKYKYEHAYDIAGVSLGANYTIIDFDPIAATVYLGLEVRANAIFNKGFVLIVEDSKEMSIQSKKSYKKDDVFRMGGLFKIGFIGEIFEPWYFHTSIGMSATNLLMSDDERGQLFTPFKTTASYEENKEETVFNMNISVMIQYRF